MFDYLEYEGVFMFQRVRERINVYGVRATDRAIELDAMTRFTAIEDAPDFVVGPLVAGEYIELRDGLIARISVKRGGEMVRFPAA